MVIDPKYKEYENVIVFQYEELLETEDNPLTKIIDTIYDRVAPMIEGHPKVKLSKADALHRVINMNKRYEEIKDKPFSFIDPFFELHGSHRNRDKKHQNNS